MGGIAGIFHLDGRTADPMRVSALSRPLAQRGAQAGVWADGPVGLSQRSHERDAGPTRPLAIHTSGPLALVADARLDNRDELAGALSTPADATDEALILAAYERWGRLCPEHLIGAFAFALWDGRSQTLFCARDHFGIRPLCYYRSGERFLFGSEIKALLADPDVPRRIREASIADYVALMPEDQASTFYEGVYRLPPAHTLSVSPDGAALRRYWAPDLGREVHFDSDAAYEDAFRSLFEETVACRLRGAAKPGSFLSGGLDSSSIAAVAGTQWRARGHEPLDTFSLVFDEVMASDERRYINAVLDHQPLRSHLVFGDGRDVFEHLDRMLDRLDEPFFGPNLYLHWEVYRAAQREGVDVLLDGLLGDSTIFHGDTYLTELAARGRFVTFAREARLRARVWGGGLRGSHYIAKRYLWSPLVAGPARDVASRLTGREEPTPRLLNSDFAERIGWTERARRFGRGERPPVRSTRAAHRRELMTGLVPAALGVVDQASAAFGVDVRYPFADRRLVEFCLALPPTQRFRDGQTRRILRRSMREYLPAVVHSRTTKGNLGHALGNSLKGLANPALRSFIEDRLPIAAPYVDVDAVRHAYCHLVEGKPVPNRVGLWQAATLVRWLEREQNAGPARPAERPDDVPYHHGLALA